MMHHVFMVLGAMYPGTLLGWWLWRRRGLRYEETLDRVGRMLHAGRETKIDEAIEHICVALERR